MWLLEKIFLQVPITSCRCPTMRLPVTSEEKSRLIPFLENIVVNDMHCRMFQEKIAC